jgi:hypothetical protein
MEVIAPRSAGAGMTPRSRRRRRTTSKVMGENTTRPITPGSRPNCCQTAWLMTATAGPVSTSMAAGQTRPREKATPNGGLAVTTAPDSAGVFAGAQLKRRRFTRRRQRTPV